MTGPKREKSRGHGDVHGIFACSKGDGETILYGIGDGLEIDIYILLLQGGEVVTDVTEKLIGRNLGGVVINNDDDFAEAFLKQAMVAVVPCSGFGMKNFVRWTYATSMENIREGLDRLEKFLA